jgi:hypothetical protein
MFAGFVVFINQGLGGFLGMYAGFVFMAQGLN